MAKKQIKVMDTSFRDGFQSIYGNLPLTPELNTLKQPAAQDFKHLYFSVMKTHLKQWIK